MWKPAIIVKYGVLFYYEINGGNMKKSIYFNPNEFLPYQRNFILITSERTVGKTYSTQLFQLKRAIEKGERFIYFVRLQDEMKKGVFKNAYMKVVEEQFPDYDIKFTYNQCWLYSEEDDVEPRLLGVCMAISEANKQKRVNFPRCRWGLFDEYIIDEKNKNEYVTGWNEPILFLKAYHTIDREEDYLTVFMLANVIEFYNPYHLSPAFNIPPTEKGKIYLAENVLYKQVEASEELKQKKKQSKFLKMIQSTEYGQYSVKGEYSGDNIAFIEARTQRAKLKFNFDSVDNTYGVWYDENTGLVYIDDTFDKNFKLWYTFDPDDMDERKTLAVGKQIYLCKWLGNRFKRGQIRWKNMDVKNKSLMAIKRMI